MNKINGYTEEEAKSLVDYIKEGKKKGKTLTWLFETYGMQRGRANDAMRELELACSMDPGNLEYQRAKEMFNTTSRRYGSAYYGDGGYRGGSSMDACDCCTNRICLDCLCECFGGDLIRCI